MAREGVRPLGDLRAGVDRQEGEVVDTAQKKLARKRRSIVELAETLGNVSEACRRREISHTQFSGYERRFQTHGTERLVNPPPIDESSPTRT
jgi:hypothetical protein